MPSTGWPRPAKNRAFSPVPQPASRTAPVTRSATSTNAGCGLPMSQGALPAYIDSKVSRFGTWLMEDSSSVVDRPSAEGLVQRPPLHQVHGAQGWRDAAVSTPFRMTTAATASSILSSSFSTVLGSICVTNRFSLS